MLEWNRVALKWVESRFHAEKWSCSCLLWCSSRSVLRPLCHLLCVLRDSRVFPGDGPGPVHQRRRHHLLEESLSAVWGWWNSFSPYDQKAVNVKYRVEINCVGMWSLQLWLLQLWCSWLAIRYRLRHAGDWSPPKCVLHRDPCLGHLLPLQLLHHRAAVGRMWPLLEHR